MHNHFHIILKHSREPLGWMMQRVMQRAAALVKKIRSVKGHVFSGRYWAEPIPTSKYLRRGIVYTHLNPCKALMCADPIDYSWSTHRRYLALASENIEEKSGLLDGLMLFAGESVRRVDVVENYMKFITFCQDRRRAGISGDWLLPGGLFWGDVPTAALGDSHWLETFTHFDGGMAIPRRTVDVHSHAIRLLQKIDAHLDLDSVREGHRLHAMKDLRDQLVCGLLTVGAKPSAVARCLNMSPNVVSRIRTAMRLGATEEKFR